MMWRGSPPLAPTISPLRTTSGDRGVSLKTASEQHSSSDAGCAEHDAGQPPLSETGSKQQPLRTFDISTFVNNNTRTDPEIVPGPPSPTTSSAVTEAGKRATTDPEVAPPPPAPTIPVAQI